MQRALTLVLVLSVAAMAADFFAFTADVLISGDPEIMGAIRGKLSYQYDPEGKLSYRKLELTLPNKYNTSTADYTEIINYTEGTKFLKCPRKCTATMWKHGVDKLFPTGNEGRDGSFKRFAESQEDIAEITFDANSLVSKVVYLSGKTITFTNVVKHDGPFDPATFDYSTWRCPKRTCKVIMDLVLVLDDSGSISYDNWAALMRFTKAISTSFEIDTLYHAGGATCVGCGIDTAAEILFNRSEARKAINPKTVVITALMTVLDKLITATCQDYPPSPLCSTVECDEGTGNCSFTPRSCDDGDFCTIDTCDASSGSTWETACKHTANPCDDSDPCTVDSCSNNQCVHKPLCDDGLRCTNDFCKATADLKNATCKHVLIDCDDYNYTVPRGDNYTCYRYFCSEEGGDLCLLKRYFTKSDDPCAECRNSTRKVKCIGGLPVAAAGAIIGAAAIAGIVVACVVGFLIFSAVSAFGTYKLVQMNRAGGGMAAHNNPMYKPNDAESVNPAYSSS
eukprot:m51a1_g11079 hypothetical protein (508) ;mRNA; r:571076-573907